MSLLDREARASRYLDAMDALHDLLACRVPGMSVDAEQLSQLISMLNDEAGKVVLRHTPGEHSPGICCANDFDDDGGGSG